MRKTNNHNNGLMNGRGHTTHHRHQGGGGGILVPPMAVTLLAFLLGCIVSGSLVLHLSVTSSSSVTPRQSSSSLPPLINAPPLSIPEEKGSRISAADESNNNHNKPSARDSLPASSRAATSDSAVLQNLKVLVVLVAFDFSQIPHLEEVLDAYHDLAVSGPAVVDVVIHATVAYPVVVIDMWNDRFTAPNFSVTIALKPKSLRLHLVDCHRQVFYEHIDDYDLFIYSEDDIRVTPTTVAAYWQETQRIETLLAEANDAESAALKPSDFNVGIVRYEYNYPPNVVMDDKTRHATQNVTRVYWEHSSFKRPDIVPNAALQVEQPPLASEYVTMKNHHQGMYLATSSLLKAWKERCQFDIATRRPGRGSQPTEGTQRVWMSSQMLYGHRHCNVQQMLPTHRFGTLTVLHLPNKNYRRVGKYRSRTFADGTEVFEAPHASLLQALELHLALKQAYPPTESTDAVSLRRRPYTGRVRMVDEVEKRFDRTHLLERRMQAYHAYVQRGGVLSAKDFQQTALVEEDE